MQQRLGFFAAQTSDPSLHSTAAAAHGAQRRDAMRPISNRNRQDMMATPFRRCARRVFEYGTRSKRFLVPTDRPCACVCAGSFVCSTRIVLSGQLLLQNVRTGPRDLIGSIDTLSAGRSVHFLVGKKKWSFEEYTEIAFDTRNSSRDVRTCFGLHQLFFGERACVRVSVSPSSYVFYLC